MPSRLILTFATFAGRIPRSTFWWSQIVAFSAFAVLFVFLDSALGRPGTWLLYPFFFWGAAAVSAKRLHDRGQSAWRLLLLLIPVIGPLWWIIALGVRAGTRGDNQYGPDPLVAGVDYLVVRSDP
jgi:uncharacterized membrane protein YhaH (DUF805 family)